MLVGYTLTLRLTIHLYSINLVLFSSSISTRPISFVHSKPISQSLLSPITISAIKIVTLSQHFCLPLHSTTMDPCSSCTSRTSNQHYIQSAGRISQSLLSPITIFTNLVILAFSYQNCYVVTTLLFTTPFNYYGSLF